MKKVVQQPLLQLQMTFRQLEPTPALKTYAERKAGKLLGYIKTDRPPHMVVGTENLLQIAELEVWDGQKQYFARASAENLYASIDSVVGKIARQLDEAHKKTRHTRRGQRAKSKKKAIAAAP